MRLRAASRGEYRVLRKAFRKWRGPVLPGGEAKRKHFRPESFDPDQLAIGIVVEMEHTRKPEIAMEIAMAHLAERSDYYALLERLEKKGKT